jgi:hypothetical protein
VDLLFGVDFCFEVCVVVEVFFHGFGFLLFCCGLLGGFCFL